MFIRFIYLTYNLLWKINIKRQGYLVRDYYNSHSGLQGIKKKKKSFYNEIALLSSRTRKIIFLSHFFLEAFFPHSIITLFQSGMVVAWARCKTVFCPYTILCWILHFLNSKYCLFLTKSFISLKYTFFVSTSQKYKTKRKNKWHSYIQHLCYDCIYINFRKTHDAILLLVWDSILSYSIIKVVLKRSRVYSTFTKWGQVGGKKHEGFGEWEKKNRCKKKCRKIY